jgi:uncharacterized protein
MTDGARRLPMFPLSAVLFPHAELPLHVFEPRYRQLMADCLSGDGEFGVVLIERGSEVGGGDQRVGVGTVAHIEKAAPLPDGRWFLVARGTVRIKVDQWLPDDPYPTAMVLPWPSGRAGDDAGDLLRPAEQALRRVRALVSELGHVAALPPVLELGADPEAAGWRMCGLAPLNQFDGQRLLETEDPGARLSLLRELCEAQADDLSRLLADGSG